MNPRHLRAVWLADLRVLTRTRWVRAATGLGVIVAALVTAVAATHTGPIRQDSMRSGAASLLLLGGIALAVCLGGGAFAKDAARGHLGLLVGNGMSPSTVGLGRVLSRWTALLGVVAVWAAALLAGAATLGEGFDRPLLIHAITVMVNLMLVLGASAALASVIGPIAAGAFGVMVYISAQAAVNLKAALDQHTISHGSRVFIVPLYAVFPRALVSPMISDMQLRGVAGPAAPSVDVNGAFVVVPTSQWPTVVWTLLWVALFGAIAAYGVRRRQL